MNDMYENEKTSVGSQPFMDERRIQGTYQFPPQYQNYATPVYERPVNCEEPMAITSIADLQRYAGGTIVRLPDFAEGQPFVARLKRPSLLVLAKSGKIPNSLLSTASQLFSKGGSGVDTDNENMLSDVYGICEVLCEAALVQPTLSEIKAAGLELSDDQLMAIFNYTQVGVEALKSFRK